MILRSKGLEDVNDRSRYRAFVCKIPCAGDIIILYVSLSLFQNEALVKVPKKAAGVIIG